MYKDLQQNVMYNCKKSEVTVHFLYYKMGLIYHAVSVQSDEEI